MSDNIMKITCPKCRSVLWIDKETEEIIKVEKNKEKKKHSLEDLLQKEVIKKAKVDERMDSAYLIGKKKKEEAKEKFEQLISKKDDNH
jgi:Zn-finger nucleic acid-binding protein